MDRSYAAEPDTAIVPVTVPQPLDLLVVGLPAGLTRQGRDPAVAVATILPGQLDHVGNKPLLILTASGEMTLSRAMLAEHATRPAFGDTETVTHPVDGVAPTRGADQFLLAASVRISLSRVRSDTALRSRSFSFSSSFRRLSWSVLKSPYSRRPGGSHQPSTSLGRAARQPGAASRPPLRTCRSSSP